jgi:hypothetical protein
VTVWWYPTDTHPRGASSRPWFRVEHAIGFPAEGHPRGASSLPCLRIVDGRAYPTMSVPGEEGPHFDIVGRDVYLTSSLDGPWYHIVDS